MMRAAGMAALCIILAACGGEDKTVYQPVDDGNSRLKVLVDGYEGEATISLNGETRTVPGNSVVTLGKWPQGSDYTLNLVQWQSGYHCSNLGSSGVLTQPFHTVVFYCSDSVEAVRPEILSIQYSSPAPRGTAWQFQVYTHSPNFDHPLQGYRVEALEKPDGASVTHLTPESPSSWQEVRFDQYGDYVLAIHAYNDIAESIPQTIEVTVSNYPPSASSIELTPSDVYTDTDVAVTADIDDDDLANLDIAYEWQINGSVVMGESGTTLSSNNFVSGDEVAVFVLLDDGSNQVREGPVSVTVKDSPASLELSGVPVRISRGTSLDVQLMPQDPDGDPVALALAYGPRGMQLSGHRLQWTADPILAAGEGAFQYGIIVNGRVGEPVSGSVVVEQDVATTRAFAGNAFQQNKLERPGRVADIDGDGKLEYLHVESGRYSLGVIQVMEISGSVSDEWAHVVHPRFDQVSDYLDATFMANPAGSSSRVAMFDGAFLQVVDMEKNRVIRSREFAQRDGFAIYHVTDNGAGEELLLLFTETDSTTSRVVAFDAKTLDEKWSTVSGDMGRQGIPAQLDADAAMEMVTEKGYVFELTNGANEWVIPDFGGYGRSIHLQRYGAGGYNRILESLSSQGAVRVADLTDKSVTKVALPTDPYSFSILTGNFDGDPVDEVMLLDFPEHYLYDLDSGFSQIKAIDVDDHQQYAALDIDDDQVDELVGGSSFGEHTYTLEVTDSAPAWAELPWQNCRRSAGYHAAGTVTLNAQEEAFIASSCPEGMELIGVSAGGATVTYNPYSDYSVGYNNDALIGLLDNDSVPEIVLGTGQTLRVLDSSTGLPDWSYQLPEQIRDIREVDVGSEGLRELLVASVDQVDMVDYYSQRVIDQIPAKNYGSYSSADVLASDPAELDGDTEGELLMATTKGVHVYSIDNEGFTPLADMEELVVFDVAAMDTNADGIQEVIVASKASQYGVTRLSIHDGSLQEKSSVLVEARVRQILPTDPLASPGQHVLALLEADGTDVIRLVEIHLPSGRITWRGPYMGGHAWDFPQGIEWMDIGEKPYLAWGGASGFLLAW